MSVDDMLVSALLPIFRKGADGKGALGLRASECRALLAALERAEQVEKAAQAIRALWQSKPGGAEVGDLWELLDDLCAALAATPDGNAQRPAEAGLAPGHRSGRGDTEILPEPSTTLGESVDSIIQRCNAQGAGPLVRAGAIRHIEAIVRAALVATPEVTS